MSGNKTKANFLGMPYGTAASRLRKLLMFKFAQELSYDDCYACGEKIECSDDLSIEHKEPWLDRENGIEKFWDLDNIAFSHLKCNIPHQQGGYKNRKDGGADVSWCCKHEEFLPIDEFGKRSSRWNGVDTICLECRSKTRPSRAITLE